MKRRGLEIAALAAGCAAWLMLFEATWWIGFAAAAAAVITGSIALRKGTKAGFPLAGILLALGAAAVSILLMQFH